ncbi:MAG: hypothetical protein K1X81_01860 [Bacteroidia bacterium]|nr:hypothetical protein [Bacteroidia bacterium]
MAGERDIRYDVGQLFQLAFGTNFPVMFPYVLEVVERKLPTFQLGEGTKPEDLKFQQVSLKDTVQGTGRISQYGHRVMFPIQLIGGNYKKFDRFGVLRDVEMKSFYLPVTTMVDFSRSKIMQETPQSTTEGGVVEMYGFEAWNIRIRGLCLDDPSHPTHKTVAEQEQAILEWEDLASGIYVAGKKFVEKNIFYMAIKEINLSQIEGRPNVVPFELTCRSLIAPEDQTL